MNPRKHLCKHEPAFGIPAWCIRSASGNSLSGGSTCENRPVLELQQRRAVVTACGSGCGVLRWSSDGCGYVDEDGGGLINHLSPIVLGLG
jgi:hypothetical protein